MIENLRASMKNIIKNNDWMDEVTKTRGVEKVCRVKLNRKITNAWQQKDRHKV